MNKDTIQHGPSMIGFGLKPRTVPSKPSSMTLLKFIDLFQTIGYQSYQCLGYFCTKHKDAKIFDNHLNPVMLVFIGQLLLSNLRRVSIWQGFSHFSGLLQLFVLAKLATRSTRVNCS